jgi:hypothetical protein
VVKKRKAEVNVLLGTRKGAFILRSDVRRRAWKFKGPFLKGTSVFHMSFDKRDGKTIYAAVNSGHFGPTVQMTRDFGKTWTNAEKPPRFPDNSGLNVRMFGTWSPVGPKSPMLSTQEWPRELCSEVPTGATVGS